MKALVLILRGLPAGATGPYGNRWVETPSLNALATRGVVYDWHFAVHPSDRPARIVWGAGRYAFPPAATARTQLVEALNASGVRAWLVTDGGNRPPGPAVGDWQEVSREADTPGAIASALEALEELADEEDWLLWVELGPLLPPWTISDEVLDAYFPPPEVEEEKEEDAEEEDEEDEEDMAEEYLEEEEEIEPLLAPEPGPIDPADDVLYRRLQTTFAAAVTQLDLMLEELLAAVGEDVLLIVTSDHGQALGEHGVVGPVRPWVHEEIAHVPLILAGPRCPPGSRVEALTASVDLAPTLAAHFGVTLEGAHGHDLHPAVLGEGKVLRDYVCIGHSEAGLGEPLTGEVVPEVEARLHPSIEWAIRTRDWFLRLPMEEGGVRRLYVKPDDRCEVNDVAQAHFHQADALEQALRAFVEATRGPGPLVPPPLTPGE